jgi:hypothetical protein
VQCWQETYRGLLPDAVLDDTGFLTIRERFWTAGLTDERYRDNHDNHPASATTASTSVIMTPEN